MQSKKEHRMVKKGGVSVHCGADHIMNIQVVTIRRSVLLFIVRSILLNQQNYRSRETKLRDDL